MIVPLWQSGLRSGQQGHTRLATEYRVRRLAAVAMVVLRVARGETAAISDLFVLGDESVQFAR